MEKDKLTKVQFWIGTALRDELKEFAHGYNLATADLYKAGAIMLMNSLKHPDNVTLNIFTRTFKDLENKQLRKKILKHYQERGGKY